MEFLPIILDIIVPLNESRPRSIHVITEYFIDHEKYFLLILLHEVFATFVGGITIVATGTIIMAYAQHTCGMLKIVRWENLIVKLIYEIIDYLIDWRKIFSFRIEHVLDNNILQHSSPQIERIICNRIVHAVDLHRRTLKCVSDWIHNNKHI